MEGVVRQVDPPQGLRWRRCYKKACEEGIPLDPRGLGLFLAIPSSLAIAPAKGSVLFIVAPSSPRQGKMSRKWQCICTFRRL